MNALVLKETFHDSWELGTRTRTHTFTHALIGRRDGDGEGTGGSAVPCRPGPTQRAATHSGPGV